MKKNLTEIVFILDRSGSMRGLEADTIGGYNSLIERQKQEDGEAIISTVLFDDVQEVLHDRVNLMNMKPMTKKQYYVRGCTALLDAVGGAIHHIGNVHKYAREEDRPEKTLFIITTDGMENSSRRYTYEKVKSMIERQKGKYGWEFLFLGANIDAISTTVTVFFDTVLSGAVSSLMIPMLYLFLGLAAGYAATKEPVLGKFRDLIKWGMQWVLKIALYLFTGFLTVTGVVSGNADAAAIKAAKITISGAVPVVGGILSDASEAVLVGAGFMRSTVGVYGLITVAALFLSPFVKMGSQYLLIKLTGGICSSLLKEGPASLIRDFATAMGLVLAAIATQTALLLISTVCLMKGVL